MRLHFRKTIGRYKKGSTHDVRDSLARVYLRANIATQEYEQKVVHEPVSKSEFVEPVPTALDVVDNYDDMSVEELRIIALERDVKVHWNAGADKIKEALRNA